jgi:hypothetical protein
MEQSWFEFRDGRKRRFNDAVWIPLRESRTQQQGDPNIMMPKISTRKT